MKTNKLDWTLAFIRICLIWLGLLNYSYSKAEQPPNILFINPDSDSNLSGNNSLVRNN